MTRKADPIAHPPRTPIATRTAEGRGVVAQKIEVSLRKGQGLVPGMPRRRGPPIATKIPVKEPKAPETQRTPKTARDPGRVNASAVPEAVHGIVLADGRRLQRSVLEDARGIVGEGTDQGVVNGLNAVLHEAEAEIAEGTHLAVAGVGDAGQFHDHPSEDEV